MNFGWNDAKSERNVAQRGYGFDYGEQRMVAVGCVGSDILTVVYTDRPGVRWIITSWPSSRRERKLWRE